MSRQGLVPCPCESDLSRVVTVWGSVMKYFLVLTQVLETFVIGSRPAAVVKSYFAYDKSLVTWPAVTVELVTWPGSSS